MGVHFSFTKSKIAAILNNKLLIINTSENFPLDNPAAITEKEIPFKKE